MRNIHKLNISQNDRNPLINKQDMREVQKCYIILAASVYTRIFTTNVHFLIDECLPNLRIFHQILSLSVLPF